MAKVRKKETAAVSSRKRKKHAKSVSQIVYDDVMTSIKQNLPTCEAVCLIPDAAKVAEQLERAFACQFPNVHLKDMLRVANRQRGTCYEKQAEKTQTVQD